eukprot:5744595-Amphidinium_carterae.1
MRIIRGVQGIKVVVPRSSQVLDEEARIVARLHVALGHPHEKSLIRLLGQQRVRPGVFDAVRGIYCDIGKKHQKPAPPRQVGMPRLQAATFGEEVSTDIFFFQ